MKRGTATIRAETRQTKRGLKALLVLVIIAVLAVGTIMFYVGTAYQSNADLQNPPVTTQGSNRMLQVSTAIFSTYLNVSLSLSNHALVGTSGTLRVQLGSTNTWSDSKAYTIQPGDWQSFLFYPTIPVSSVDVVQVST